MSHSPTDLAAGWTFVSSSSDLNEEIQNVDSAGDRRYPDESHAEAKKDTSLNGDKTKEVANPSGVEEIEDDLPSVSSESESLPSSDVDVLEESVGPDHEILEVSSSSHASSFSLPSPLEGLPGFHHSMSVSTSSEFPQKREADAVTDQDVICQPVESLTSEVSSVRSPKSLAEAAASAQQLAQSSKPPNNSSHTEPKEQAQDTINVQNSSKTLDNSSHSEPEELQQQKQKCCETAVRDSVSHSKPEDPLQEKVNRQRQEVSKQKPVVKKQTPVHLADIRPVKRSGCKTLVVAVCEFLRDTSTELTNILVYFIAWIFISLVVFWLLPSASDMGFLSIDAAKELKHAQDETLKCLGLQHLTAVENNHYPMLLTNVCMNDSDAWKEMFEKLLSREKALKTLLHEVYHETSDDKKTEIIEKFSSYTKTNMEGIRLDLIILQMEHLELLELSEKNAHLKEKQNDLVLPDLLSEKLEEQEGMLNQLREFIERLKIANFALKSLDAELKITETNEKRMDIASLKPRICRLELENVFLSYRLQHMLDEFENGEFLDPQYWLGLPNFNSALNNIESSKVEELVEKVNYLLSSNDEMRRLYSHFSVMKQHLKRGDKKETNLEFSGAQIENLKSAVEELLGVHQSFSGELLEVKKWNEMLAAITNELRNAHEDVSSGYWNWSSFKRAFKGMFSGTKQNLAGILEDIKHLDISEFFSHADKEGKSFTKELFKSLSGFWEKTGMKSKEYFAEALNDLGTDFTQIFSPLSSKSETDTDSQELPKNSEMPKESSKEKYYANDNSVNQESSTSDYTDDWNKFKSDWLFQRAVNRATLRHAARTGTMNWYLRRGHSTWHSPMTKEQEELLQKMEASSYPPHAKSYSRESNALK